MAGATALLAAFGLWQIGGAAAIHAKAWLAQEVLLERAWARAKAGADRPAPWPWADFWPVARLEVPALGVDHIVLHGTSGEALAFGPGHLSASAVPGARRGQIVLAGHRDTSFAFLGDLRAGMILRLTDAHGRVTRFAAGPRRVVSARASGIDPARGAGDLVLTTCWPLTAVTPGGEERLALFARRMGAEGGM